MYRRSSKLHPCFVQRNLVSSQLRIFFVVIAFFFTSQEVRAQLFDHPDNVAVVSKGIDYIYNVQPDSAEIYITKIEKRLPDHPAIPMMRALKVLWTYIPVVTVDSVFEKFSGYLYETIALSSKLDGGKQEDPEAIFFEMTAHGLLAEYYADGGHYMKALGEAGKAYDLVKKGFELSEQIPDFLLTSGVYNYFREKYPEKHPVYKPLLWVFKNGDTELGIQQIKAATRKAVLTKVEAYIYLSYIYLRYEYEPEKAQSYLWTLAKKYPNNLYIKSKLLESQTPRNDFKKAPLSYINELRQSDRPYYQMAGDTFLGMYFEKVSGDMDKAVKQYQEGIRQGEKIPGHGRYYRSIAYLGLGRIFAELGDKAQAKMYLESALNETDSEEIASESKKILDRLK